MTSTSYRLRWEAYEGKVRVRGAGAYTTWFEELKREAARVYLCSDCITQRFLPERRMWTKKHHNSTLVPCRAATIRRVRIRAFAAAPRRYCLHYYRSQKQTAVRCTCLTRKWRGRETHKHHHQICHCCSHRLACWELPCRTLPAMVHAQQLVHNFRRSKCAIFSG